MTTQTFFATKEELELATQILVTRGRNGASSADYDEADAGGGEGSLQGDQAKDVFNRSSLPPATLRVIWNMSSEMGNGVLLKHEIAKALRLIGWVQAGEMLSEKLLSIGMCVCLGSCRQSFIDGFYSWSASDFGWNNE